jgi:hypothetical protein
MITNAGYDLLSIEIKKLFPFLLPQKVEFLSGCKLLFNNKLQGWIFVYFAEVLTLNTPVIL